MITLQSVSIILKQSSAISWDSLAKESEIKSHKTVSSYVEDFENMFVLLVLYFFDLNKKVPNFAKNKKLYFSDPFVYKQDYKGLYYFNKGILITKDTLKLGEKYSAVPAHLILAMF